jgi:hypothetical protein
MRLKLLPACVLASAPVAASAQTLRGVVVDQLDRPLAGVVVQLSDSTSRVVLRALTNERGEYRFVAPADGSYRVRSTRIGFRPTTSDAIALTRAVEVTRRITLASAPVLLDPIRSVVRTTCRTLGLDSTAATFTAWEQVRAALAAAEATDETKELGLTSLTYERKQTLDGFTVRQGGAVSITRGSQPWHSVSADSLRRAGYVAMEADGKGRVFHGPDARVLGSDEFTEDHCFHLVADADTGRIGIAFEPVPDRRNMPEIIGTVSLDRSTSELRELEWQYINVARNIDETATGGRLRFTRLRNGAWVISRWHIRMPLVEMANSGLGAAVTFRGEKIDGGELVAAVARNGTDTLWTGPKMTLHGFAYDSLSKHAMTSALIGIAGSSRSTITDSEGFFSFPDLAPGAYRLITQHDALEAIGVPYQVTAALLATGIDSVTVTMPSFETMWRIACESAPPGRDTALVYGTVRGIGRRKPIGGATVHATWVDVESKGRKFDTKRWHLEGLSDSTGTYVLCGVPTQTGLRVRAVNDSAESGIVDVLPLTGRLVDRLDLAMSFDPGARGVVTGVVLGRNAVPVGGARVIAEGAQEVRTDDAGRFTLRGVPLGTQQVEIIAIGLQPVARMVDVSLTDTARIELHVTRPQLLQRVNVIASTVRQQFVADFNARKTKGLGIFRDSMQISMHASLNTVFMQVQGVKMVRNQVFFPRGPGDTCEPIVWIDGVHVQSIDDLLALRPSDLAAFEVYIRELTIPSQYLVRNSRTPQCGAIIAWTKWYWEGNRTSKPPG